MVTIVQTDDTLGGEPRIDGTRIAVLDVAELVVDGEYTPPDVADQLDCSLAAIYSALAYYHAHPAEMRTLRREREEMQTKLADTALTPPEPAQ